MKKLLMAMAILAVGATAFGAEQKADAPVRVRAEIVDESLVISDINGRPILLDFEKISKQQKTDKNAFVDFKVEAAGEIQNVQSFALVLGKSSASTTPEEVTLTNIDASKNNNNTLTANLKLDKYEGATGNLTAGTVHTGRINGTIKANTWTNNEIGVYEGQTELKVTVTTN